MSSSNAQRVQGAGPSSGDGDPIDVTVLAAGLAADRVSQGTITGINQTVVIDCSGLGSVGISLLTDGSWSGDVVIEARGTGASIWQSIWPWNSDIVNNAAKRQRLGFTTAAKQYDLFAEPGGWSEIRVRCYSYTAGQMAVALRGSVGPLPNLDEQPVSGQPLDVMKAVAVFYDNASGQFGPPTAQQGPSVTGLSSIFRYIFTLARQYAYNGVSSDAVRTPVVFKTVQANAAGNTALWTPVAGKTFRLMRYMVTVTGDATLAAGAVLTVSLFDGGAGATGQAHDVFVPAMAVSLDGVTYNSGWIDLGNGVLSAAANNVLNVNLSAALTAGNVRVIACGTEE